MEVEVENNKTNEPSTYGKWAFNPETSLAKTKGASKQATHNTGAQKARELTEYEIVEQRIISDFFASLAQKLQL